MTKDIKDEGQQIEKNVLALLYHYFDDENINFDILEKADFRSKKACEMFEVLKNVKERFGYITPPLVADYLFKRDQEDLKLGRNLVNGKNGEPHLDTGRIKPIDFFPLQSKLEPDNFVRYVSTLKSFRRDERFVTLIKRAWENEKELSHEKLANMFITEIDKIFRGSGEYEKDDLIMQALERVENAKAGMEMPTGFRIFDGVWHGFQRGELHLFGADSGHFKTTGSLNLIRKPLEMGKKVLWMDMEMGRVRLMSHFIAIVGGIAIWKVKKGLMMDEDWKKYTEASGKVSEYEFIIDDKSRTLDDVKQKVMLHQPDITVIDNFQKIDFMQTGDFWGPHRAAGDIKDMAMTYNTAVLLLSQVTRTAREIRSATAPTLENLFGSRGLKHHADVISIGHWEWKDWTSTGQQPSGKDLESIKHLYQVSNAKVREDGLLNGYLIIDAEHGMWKEKGGKEQEKQEDIF